MTARTEASAVPAGGRTAALDPRAPSGPAGRKVRLRRTFRTIRSLRRTAKDWLDRPMTSWHLVLAIFALLLGFGLLMVLSASSISAFRSRTGSAFSTFENQAVFALLGLAGFVFAARVSPKFVRRLSFPAVLISIGLLAAVLAIGMKLNGARSWLGLGGFSFQPSEIAKVALLLWMAHVLAARRHTLRSLRALLIPVLPVFALMVALIMLQPDLGTTVSLCLVFFGVLWFAGAPMWIFAVLATGGVAGVVYLATSVGYRNARIEAWLNPTMDNAWQLMQGYYGMGHGGIFGAGLGQSMAKWSWLPNADSDFIFAIIGEELGLIGAGILVILFGLLAYTGMRIARRNVDPFIKIVAASATVWMVGQAAINIGYVVGLLPVTGIPLPMISAGGTSLVVCMLVFGLLANFARREPQAAAALATQGPGRFARFLGVGRVDRDHDPDGAGTGRSRRARQRKPPKPPKSPKAPKAPKAQQTQKAQPRQSDPAARRRDPSGRAGRPAPADPRTVPPARRGTPYAGGFRPASDPGRPQPGRPSGRTIRP